jgi:hypothetical protein
MAQAVTAGILSRAAREGRVDHPPQLQERPPARPVPREPSRPRRPARTARAAPRSRRTRA